MPEASNTSLPQDVTEAVAFHHDPAASLDDSFSTLTAVHAANVLCCETDQPADSQLEAPAVDSHYLGRLGLDCRVDQWREVAASARDLV